MWVCLNEAFISIVEDRDDSTMLMVRARVKGHLEKLFGQKVVETPDADYRFRCRVPRGDVANILSARVYNIKYDNFKNSVKDDKLHHAYSGFWGIMYRLQDSYLPRKVAKKIGNVWKRVVPKEVA